MLFIKRSWLLIAAITSIAAGIFLYLHTRSPQQIWTGSLTIPTLQVSDSQLVNRIRTTIAEQLQRCCNIQLYYEYCTDDPAATALIAKRLLKRNPPLALGIGTAASQALAHEIDRQDLDTTLIFSSVTDPVHAGIVDRLQGGRKMNAVGTSDFMKADQILLFALQLLPHSKKIGYIHNPLEDNSVATRESLTAAAMVVGVQIVVADALHPSEVASAAAELSTQADVLIAGGSNLTISGIKDVLAACADKIPVISNDLNAVHDGALAAIGPDQIYLAENTADIITAIARNQSNPRSMAVIQARQVRTIINLKVAKRMQIQIPAAAIDVVDEVIK